MVLGITVKRNIKSEGSTYKNLRNLSLIIAVKIINEGKYCIINLVQIFFILYLVKPYINIFFIYFIQIINLDKMAKRERVYIFFQDQKVKDKTLEGLNLKTRCLCNSCKLLFPHCIFYQNNNYL